MLLKLEKIVRKNILHIKPYSSARDEFSGKEGVFLDANENPFGKLNRYPDPLQKELKQKISEIKSVDISTIFIGNGSDEIIDWAYRIFCEPAKDKALAFSPTYGMYDVSAEINNVELIKIPLTASFQIDFKKLKNYFFDDSLKLIFVCSPNNPTGNTIENIDWILERFKGIVIVDEAYIDFSTSNSFVSKIKKYPNLIVLQTLSKAWGLAAARIGIGFANPKIISVFNKVKAPYNVSDLNQQAALKVLENIPEFERRKKIILEQKKWLTKELKKIVVVKNIFSSDANFILIETTNANMIYKNLVAQNVITRNRNNMVKNCIRITVGNPAENKKLIAALKKI